MRFSDRTCHGATEIASYFEDAFVAIPDFHMEVNTIVEDGDDVFVHWHLTIRTRGRSWASSRPTSASRRRDDHFVFATGTSFANFVVFDQMQYCPAAGDVANDSTAPDKALKLAFNAPTKLAAKLKR